MKDEFDTKLELLTDIDVDEQRKGINVLIKHDYFSSDNANGKKLLDSILGALNLTADTISNLIITDSAVKLINSSEELNTLINNVRATMICRDSAQFYDVDLTMIQEGKVRIVSIDEIADSIILNRPDIIIG